MNTDFDVDSTSSSGRRWTCWPTRRRRQVRESSRSVRRRRVACDRRCALTWCSAPSLLIGIVLTLAGYGPLRLMLGGGRPVDDGPAVPDEAPTETTPSALACQVGRQPRPQPIDMAILLLD